MGSETKEEKAKRLLDGIRKISAMYLKFAEEVKIFVRDQGCKEGEEIDPVVLSSIYMKATELYLTDLQKKAKARRAPDIDPIELN
jgi:hypothetical protein